MAEVDTAPKFGATLKDGFKPVNAWVSNGINWLDDIQQFYRERSAIEREYASKLSALAKKYFERKAKKSSSLSVGDTPTVTPGSLESASMTTWTVQLTTLESRAAEHDKYAGQLIANLADPLKHLQTRYEELRKLHADFAGKLEKERDGAYGDLRKMKGKYDSACQELESRRKKSDGAFDHGKQKAALAYQQQQNEVYNVKNTYLININVTNKQKERYYHEYVPELLDSMQDLSETRINRLNQIWLTAADLEKSVMTRSTSYLDHLSTEIPRNNPVLDSMMFMRHNLANWQEPGNLVFEPSPVWHDDDAMITNEAAKNFLRNILLKSKSQLIEAKRDSDGKRKEVDNARKVRQLIREGKDKRDEVECVRAVFHLQEGLHEAERKKVTAEVEVATVTQAVGDVSIGAQNHDFKSETFKIPTNCDLCGDRIWGLSAKGFVCRDCGYTCHSKCELKVPADCPGEQTKEEKKRLKIERQEAASRLTTSNGTMSSGSASDLPGISRSDTVNSMNTLSSGYSHTAHRSISSASMPPPPEQGAPEVPAASKPAPAPAAAARKRVMAPPPMHYASDPDAGGDAGNALERKGKMLYEYQKNGDGEITVHEGREVILLEPDDGTGWMKVRAGYLEGLVPATYVELFPPTSAPTPSTPMSARPDSTYSHSSSASLSASIAGSIGGAVKKKGPAVAPKRGAKKLKYVEALYDYEARSDAEHSMAEGERFVLINKDSGDGWAEVEKGGKTAVVPANYIQEV
ncbi:FCH-domain-containing protein [Rhizodiscina lignyota]|uniref:Protein BZZ1 n=1 Tax=Rhizodiscina lignyota TaxID=1504668 RepID=A0A9P4IQF6_9PEZI|nr:FCH-domain-containing protein [Rhizodiscina lignyota]